MSNCEKQETRGDINIYPQELYGEEVPEGVELGVLYPAVSDEAGAYVMFLRSPLGTPYGFQFILSSNSISTSEGELRLFLVTHGELEQAAMKAGQAVLEVIEPFGQACLEIGPGLLTEDTKARLTTRFGSPEASVFGNIQFAAHADLGGALTADGVTMHGGDGWVDFHPIPTGSSMEERVLSYAEKWLPQVPIR